MNARLDHYVWIVFLGATRLESVISAESRQGIAGGSHRASVGTSARALHREAPDIRFTAFAAGFLMILTATASAQTNELVVDVPGETEEHVRAANSEFFDEFSGSALRNRIVRFRPEWLEIPRHCHSDFRIR